VPASAALRTASVSRRAAWDATFVGLTAAHAALLLTVPSILLIGLAQWWSANTIAHNFIHRPFFRSRRLNAAYSAFLSLILGFPQRLWKSRHLSHHAGQRYRWHWSRPVLLEAGLVAGLWIGIAAVSPRSFLTVYLPGWMLGLALCQLHGYYEHAAGTRSYYGRVYNALFFNDGFHVEHHERPGDHWTVYGERRHADDRPSRWPPVLRWLEGIPARSLTALEHLALRSAFIQRFVVRAHARAFEQVLDPAAAIDRITVVGGGLFPRTALVLRQVRPRAAVTILDARADHLAVARRFLADTAEFRQGVFNPTESSAADLLVIPLAFDGDRRVLYERPPASRVVVHDWLWSPHGRSVVVSWLLLKRINLIER
jgi:hypothetical protein